MTPDREARLAQALAAYLAALEAGRVPVRSKFLADYPDLGPELDRAIDAVDAVQGVRRAVVEGPADVIPPFPPRTVIGGYRVVRVVGRGGMAVVYEAVDNSLDRRVALKVLPAAAAGDSEARRRFLHEARTAALLQHPHIVPVYAVGEADDQVPFIAMQFVDGASLAEVVRAIRRDAGLNGDADVADDAGLIATGLTTGFGGADDGPPPIGFHRRVARLGAAVADALEYAHGCGVIHRDVKPANLLVDVRGHVWLADFGLAKLATADATAGGRAGTLRYMAPEQAMPGRAVDGRADVYGLAASLYELLALRPAFAAPTDTELLRQVTTCDPPPIRRHSPFVPVDLETVVLKALAKEPADRYTTAATFAADLQRFADGLPVLARPLTRTQRGWRWTKRRRRALLVVAAALTAGLVVGLAASTGLLLAAYRRADAERALRAAGEESVLDLLERRIADELAVRHAPGGRDHLAWCRALRDQANAAADQPGASPRLQLAAVRAAHRLIEQSDRQSDAAAVVRDARDAHARASLLATDSGFGRAGRVAHARSCHLLGWAMQTAGDATWPDWYHEAARLYAVLDAEQPNDPAVLNHLGKVNAWLAVERSLVGDHTAARSFAAESLAVNERLARRYPTGHPLSYVRLVESHLKLAGIESRAGRPGTAEGHFRAAEANEATALRELPIGVARPDTYEWEGLYGEFLAGRGLFAEARERLTGCLRVADDQATRFPSHKHYADWVVRSRAELGRLAYLEGKEAEARVWFAQALPARADLTPAVVEVAGKIPMSGVVDPAAVLAAAERFAADPGGPDHRSRLALAFLRAGQPSRAEGILRDLIPRQVHEPQDAAWMRFALAVCLAQRGQVTEAQAEYQAAAVSNYEPYLTSAIVPCFRREAEGAISAAERAKR